jgi:hypothetical protein
VLRADSSVVVKHPQTVIAPNDGSALC